MIDTTNPQERVDAIAALCNWFKTQDIDATSAAILMIDATAVILGHQAKTRDELDRVCLLSSQRIRQLATEAKR